MTHNDAAQVAKPATALQEAAAALFRVLEKSMLTFFVYFCTQHVRKDSPKFHVEIIKAAKEAQFLAVAAPRQSAKSTILVFLVPLDAIIFKRRRFIVIIQNTFKKAAMSLDTIKKELQENHKIRDHFPGITISKDAEGDSIIRHPDGFETKVLCKGVDQIGSLRGVKFGAYRPDLIIGDDMEDDELVRSPERRAQLHDDFNDALIPAGDKGNCKYIFIGTILHDDSLIARLVSKDYYKEYKKLFYKARIDNPDGTRSSLWPEQWTVEELDTMEREKPGVFAKEYQNDPVAGKNARFLRADFRYWRQEGKKYALLDLEDKVVTQGYLSDCRAAIACDLAWKEKREADSTVILPGFITPDGEILVQSYFTKKGARPDEIGTKLFDMVEDLRELTGSDVPVGFEKAMLENVTQFILRQRMMKEGRYFTTKELVWDADKETRILTRLEPRYSQHVMFHKRGMGDLETQLERFPSGTHDDIVDALQGLVQLLKWPKAAKREAAPDDVFMRVRKMMIDARKPRPTVRSSGGRARIFSKISPF